MEKDLKSVFNGLSKMDRFKLKGAALTETFSEVLKDDTKKRPWRYPFYAVYMTILVVPLLGAGVVMAMATMGWISLRRTPWTRSVHDKLKDAFNAESLVRKYKDYIEPVPSKPDHYRVKSLGMAWSTTKKTSADACEATRIAFKSLAHFVFG